MYRSSLPQRSNYYDAAVFYIIFLLNTNLSNRRGVDEALYSRSHETSVTQVTKTTNSTNCIVI